MYMELSVLTGCLIMVISAAAIYYVWRLKKHGIKTTAVAQSTPTTGQQDTTVLNGPKKKTNVSTFGGSKADDNGIGFAGLLLKKLGEANLKWNNNPIYPAAVHQYDGPSYLYKIIHLTGSKFKPVYLLVTDICDADDGPCNPNRAKGGLDFLVDVHASGWQATGLNENSFTTGEFQVVGEMRPADITKAAGTGVWLKNGNDSIVCSCTGKCSDKEIDWRELKDCK